MSVTSNESSKLSDLNYVLKRYSYYKSACKELANQNEELYQELHTTKKKLELKTLECNDASSLLEEKNKELDDMVSEMDQLKKDMVKKEKYIAKVNNDNAIFSEEIIQLKTQLNELSLENNAKLLALDKIKKNEIENQQVLEKNLFGNSEIDVKCDSWWCPKHSNLAKIHKKLDIKTLDDKIEIDQAMKRQRYWTRQGEIRCCVRDRKSGVDKHADPPSCWIKYNSTINKNIDFIEKKVSFLNINLSSSEDEL